MKILAAPLALLPSLPIATGFGIVPSTCSTCRSSARCLPFSPNAIFATRCTSQISGHLRATKDKDLGAIITLPEFLETTGELTLDERRTIIDQALVIFDDVFVHLPLKKSMHVVDPVQELKLLRRRVERFSERQFHNEMISIFKGVRDLHTNYLLPSPYNANTAFLPFMMKEYWDSDGVRRYVVSGVNNDYIPDKKFEPGVEVTHWSGVPIERAVEISAEREAGSNEEAQHVRGLDHMTQRPMRMSLPPDEEWVEVAYVTQGGKTRDIRLPWNIFQQDTGGLTASGDVNDPLSTMLAYDLDMELTNQCRKALFVKEKIERSSVATRARSKGGAELEAFMGDYSIYPGTFEYETLERSDGDVGYLRIRTFGNPSPEEFIPEVIRILELLPQDRLIIDVRGNGGGYITNGERMLQLFSDNPVFAERLHFINTETTLAITKSPVGGGFASQWEKSIYLSGETGAVYSQGFPIEDPSVTNSIGRRYPGKVVLITDARCYSTTDIFAAGFQDNNLGKIIGVDNNTGAGGANVFTHDLLQFILPGPNSPFKPLPKDSNMRVAIRRTTRVGENAGLPVEDVGVVPDFHHLMTFDDISNPPGSDLIDFAVEVLNTY